MNDQEKAREELARWVHNPHPAVDMPTLDAIVPAVIDAVLSAPPEVLAAALGWDRLTEDYGGRVAIVLPPRKVEVEGS